MYGQFFYQLTKDVEKAFGCALDKGERQVLDLTVKLLQKRARRRATETLVNGMCAQKRYSFDTGFRHAIDLFVNIVVAASFGDLPTGVPPDILVKDFEKIMGAGKPKLQGQAVFAKWVDESTLVPAHEKEAWIAQYTAHFAEDSIWQNVQMKQQVPVTADEIYKAMAKIEADKQQAYSEPAQYYGPPKSALQSMHAPNSGLQGAKTGRWSVKEPKAEPAPTEALADLLKLAEDNAKRLVDEQMEKEIGMPLEEAKKQYPGVFGSHEIKGAVLENGDELNITVTYTTES